MPAFDWSNKIYRKKFEDDLSRHRDIKRNWPLFNPKGGGGGIKVSHWSGDWLPFLTGSSYGHKNS